MLDATIRVHEGLLAGGRVSPLTRVGTRLSALELAALLLTGCFAAMATAFLDLDLRIPGHAILRVVFPMAFGLALVPRRAAGTIMGAGALATALGLYAGGLTGMGVGAITSLCLTGPLLDLSLLRARPGWKLYFAFTAAGIVSNVAALIVRGTTKLLTMDMSGGRRFAEWLPQAACTYILCGAIAGIVSALFWFHLNAGKRSAIQEDLP